MSGVLHLCVYNNNLHSLVRNTVHCTALVLIFISPIHCICQKYLPLVHDSESEEGYFSPLGEGVKYLPNPHNLHFFFVKSNILIAFCLFLFRYYEGKDYLYSWNIDIRSLCFL